MNVNLANRNIFQNFSKYQKLLNSATSHCRSDARLSPSTCECSTFAHLATTDANYGRPRSVNLAQVRWLSEKSGPPSKKLPPMAEDFPKLVWPSLIKSFRNFILATFIIKPYLDREFNLPDFVAGSKKAVEVVSRKIAEGDLKSLEGLVTSDVIPNIQKAITLMSLSQREQIAINIDDIYFCFPYQVGVILNDEEGKDQKRFVEITMVYHSLRGLAAMRSRGEEPPLNMGMLPEYQQLISICNYRFIREFTKGVESDWTVNLLNHFSPIDDE